jgi:hypothetical protein
VGRIRRDDAGGGGEAAVSTDWIVVAVVTGLLVIVTAYSVFLAFRSGKDEKADDRRDERSRAEAEPSPKISQKAA